MASEEEVRNVDKFFNELFKLQKTGDYFFRGISKDDHYAPTLFREYKKVRSKGEDPIQVWEYETRLLERFGRYSVQYLPASTTPLDWVANAQHFGLPTRLLDWTFDPFFGLYFAVFYNKKDKISEKEDDDYYRLLIINKNTHLYFEEIPRIMPMNFWDRVDTNIQLLEDFKYLVGFISGNIEISQHMTHNSVEKDFIQQIKEDLVQGEEPSKLFFCSINHSNPRIVAQNGLFQIPRTYGAGENKGWIKQDIVKGCDKIYKIHKRYRQDILDLLSKMNVNSIRLFPDLQNICDYIRKSTK